MNSDIHNPTFDVAVVGGGLAGLSLSILLATSGYKTILFEKNKYPFHRVCGEYISRESVPFLRELGVDLNDFPAIRKLEVTTLKGKKLRTTLDVGGIGISRYFLDNELKNIAEKSGVEVMEGVSVEDVRGLQELFEIRFSGGAVKAKVVAGCFGKRSKLDVVWKRKFIRQKKGALNNFIGVKYHISGPFEIDKISLHNFEGGYCGMSKVEENKYCLCYLTTAKTLRENNNSLAEMEKNVLSKNPALKFVFDHAMFLNPPVTISQISFEEKKPVENHVLMVGDAAGMITPLCGNGMSMAFHAAKIAWRHMDAFLKKEISRTEMERRYVKEWESEFSNRMKTGRRFQRFFGKTAATEFFISLVNVFPFLKGKLVSMTHGKEF